MVSALILAAGAGTRMKSDKPKVAHEVLGKPLVRWVIDAAHDAGIKDIISVLGYQSEKVAPLVEDDTQIVIQESQLGTGDAVNAARDAMTENGVIKPGSLIVLSGDCPLITPETIVELVKKQQETQAAVVVLTMQLENPFGYGRIVRTQGDSVARIVEQKDCSAEEAAITECNSGFYCFDAPALFDALTCVSNDNAQGEYYLTDVLEICRNNGRDVLALTTNDAQEAMGVNSRVQLSEAARVMQKRINYRHMANGVTMWDPTQVWIGADVEIDQDVELLPQVILMGKTHVGSHSIIGPNTRLTDTSVGAGCTIDETVAIEAVLENDVTCGPRAYLRQGTHLCQGAKVGTHVEIKKSIIGAGSKVPHLSYIGDTTMGSGVNIGAGSITCNYDGFSKHPTIIGDNVFVGSDTMMVAPVTLGSGSIVGAGSVITCDVAEDALALERNEQKEIAGWASRHRKKLSIQNK